MSLPRCSGILLHPSSLPGPFGIGDLGPTAHEFAGLLAEAGQKIWQILPLGPTGKSYSPYKCLSSFAGNPLLISPLLLREHGYLSKRDLARPLRLSSGRVDFAEVRSFKDAVLRRAFLSFSENGEFREFAKSAEAWLEPFAHFMALKSIQGGRHWTKFDRSVSASPKEIQYHKFVQFEFYRQWGRLRNRAKKLGISILGDIPFYVEHDSADVWCHPKFFNLDANGEPLTVGGVPPDYFSANGQLWGNPTYHWKHIEQSGFRFWIERLRSTLELVDLVRLDHFRGFIAFWAVRAGERTARKGHWVEGPASKLFRAAERALGELPIIAENLGVITPEVESIRRQFGFPGMAVLQFAFDSDDSIHRPHNYEPNTMAFTGTHDNDTVCGWWKGLRQKQRSAVRARVAEYLQLGSDRRADIHWKLIAAVLTSVARFALVPMQDVLGLSSAARMNVPGRARGNWRWRMREGAFRPEIIARLSELVRVTGR